MKERGIIFNSDMVRAIRDGRKTQTRRTQGLEFLTYDHAGIPICDWALSEPPKQYNGERLWRWQGHKEPEIGDWYVILQSAVDDNKSIPLKCPYGVVGDRLYVRETWADTNTPDGPAITYKADGSYQSWQDFSKEFGPDYGAGPSMDYDKYPGDYVMWWEDLLNGEPDHGWRPSIHMPRWASRINLEITDIRVERLQDITIEDILNEGAVLNGRHLENHHIQLKWIELWDSINGKKHSWKSNPWVWKISFEIL